MAVFTCDVCGGAVEYERGAAVAMCPFCGTKRFFAPKADNSNANNTSETADLTFGRWGGEPIQWRFITRVNDRVLAITQRAIETRRFDGSNNTWETCELKRWLWEDFERGAFSEAERRKMATHPFSLSFDEALRYFKNAEDLVCFPTEHAKKQGAWTNDKGACLWWLRSPGHFSDIAAYVHYDGGIRFFGNGVRCDGIAVRPALWLNL